MHFRFLINALNGGYPAHAEDYKLHTIPEIMESFGLVTGLLDHTQCRDNGNPEDSFSLELAELRPHFSKPARRRGRLKVDHSRKSIKRLKIGARAHPNSKSLI